MDIDSILFRVKDYSDVPSMEAETYEKSVALFQEELLKRLEKAVARAEVVIVDVSGTSGYFGDFLDDVFLNLQEKFNARAKPESSTANVTDYLMFTPSYSIAADLMRDRMKALAA